MQREIIRVEPIDSNFEKWGAPVSTCTRAGNMVFVSGMPPFDPETGEILVHAPFERQVELILEHIKKALADEVLFGRLKGGGHVRVVVVTDEAGNSKLGFEYPDGPVKPRQEKLPEPRRAKAKRWSTPRRKPSGPRRNDTPRGSSVPNVPLVKV